MIGLWLSRSVGCPSVDGLAVGRWAGVGVSDTPVSCHQYHNVTVWFNGVHIKIGYQHADSDTSRYNVN